MGKHILHIVNSYGGTTVYKSLFQALDKQGIRQTIYVPLNAKNRQRVGNHSIEFSVEGSNIIYALSRKWYHKFLYNSKISLIKREILKSVNIGTISLIHAHTLCLDGAVAYEISKNFNIPYIVAIRNTDINTYYKKLFWKRSYFENILVDALSIIFISPAYKKKFTEEYVSDKTLPQIKNKFFVIPNGVGPLFFNNRVKEKKIHDPVRIIYSGAFQKGKNICELIQACAFLVSKGYSIQCTAVGLGLSNRKNDKEYIREVKSLAQQFSWMELLESVSQDELKNLFLRNDIFAMPSVPETFGLVYVEALTQGLPLIYSKDQGFDGFFKNGEIGYAVKPFDIMDISNKIESVIINYNEISQRVINCSLDEFTWEQIARKYLNIYN